MNPNKETLIATLLPATLINKDFVKGDDKCNCEIYLLELLNKSNWFRSKYPEGFFAPSSEANGECDANNNNYNIDFKLFASKTAIRARNLLSPSISVLEDGETVYSKNKGQYLTLQVTRLFAAFRKQTLSDLIALKQKQISEPLSIEGDIQSALKVLEVNKHIMLFFPYAFSFVDGVDVSDDFESIKVITSALAEDFCSAFEYRKKSAAEYDTYFTCIYNAQFIIFRIENSEMILIDRVSTTALKSYNALSEYNDY